MSSSDEVEALLARAGISRDELTEESMERIGSASLPHPAAEAASRGAANRSSGSVTEVATPVAGGARGVGARPSRRAGAARAAKPVSSAGSAHSTPLSSDVDGNDVSGFSSFSSMGDSMDFTLESEVQPRRRGAGGRGGANDSPLSNGSLDDSSDDESTRGGGDGGGRRAQLRLRAEFADEIARRDARVSDLHHRNALMERELVRLQRTHEAALRQARDTARDEIRIVREKMASILRELPQLRAQLRAQKMAITPTSVKLSSARYQELLRQPLDELTLVEHVAVQVHPLIARSAEGASMAERDAALAEAARLRALIERGGDDADAELSADASSAAHLKSRLALAAKEKELLSTRVAELTAREQRASDDAAAKAVKIAELEAAREKLYAELLRGREERRVAHEEHVTLELEKLRSAAGARGSTLRDAEGRDARALRDALAAADELREETASLKTTNHELVIQRGLAQSDAQQTIVELRSDLKLKRYEIERLGVSYDEQQQAARKLHLTNEMLSEKLDVIGREFNVMHAETSTKIAYLEAQLEGSVEEASGRAGFAPAPVRPAEAHSIRVTPATPGFAGARAAGASPLSTPSRAAGTCVVLSDCRAVCAHGFPRTPHAYFRTPASLSHLPTLAISLSSPGRGACSRRPRPATPQWSRSKRSSPSRESAPRRRSAASSASARRSFS
jgi:hypothetical protein